MRAGERTLGMATDIRLILGPDGQVTLEPRFRQLVLERRQRAILLAQPAEVVRPAFLLAQSCREIARVRQQPAGCLIILAAPRVDQALRGALIDLPRGLWTRSLGRRRHLQLDGASVLMDGRAG